MILPTHGLTAAAEHLLTPPPGVTYTTAPGTRARAAAALLRLALDETMDTFWKDVSPAMTRTSGRTKALCLERYVSPSVARQWYAVWSALSAACHHHICELPPTPAEVRAWHQDVIELLTVLPATRR
ncbi:hypothetical protein ACFWFI_38405 [Streptomyces sp. NPDC060209]|uniref:hypothetical protein n=1 Tax=Streptomyces sp. NPDC060209 TaxID=3347073 RepID=UPI00364730F0